MDLEKYLEGIFYDVKNAASFSGPEKLYKFVKQDGKHNVSKYRIRKWLQRQEPYSMQRPARRRFQKAMVNVNGINDQFDMDLMDMTKYAKENDGVTFILVVIDIFSKFLWLRPLKDKKGSSVASALKVKSRKYQGVFEVKSRVKTWQVRGIWSQQLEH